MAGYGRVFASGILGGIGGMASGVYANAVEEQKAETERIRAERLAKLATEGYRDRADIDIGNIDKKGAAETAVAVKAEEAKRPGIIDTRRATAEVDTEAAETRTRKAKEIEGEFVDQDAERAGKIAKATGEAQHGFRLAEINAGAANAMKVAILNNDEAAKRDWTAGADGKYYDANGKAVTTRVKIEGRGFEEVPVMAPKSKIDGVTKGDPNWYLKEELDSINRRIEKASSDTFAPPDMLEKLVAEKRALLKRMGMPDSGNSPAAGGGKPWERKWGAS